MGKDIGAMWLKDGKGGSKYMSGVIEIDGVKHNFVAFKNDYKKVDNQPDYKIYPKQERTQEADDDGTSPF